MEKPKVIKESGEVEEFNRGKLLDSMLNSGVGPGEAERIAGRVEAALKSPFTTRKIFTASRRLLRASDEASTMRYSLKKAILALGPSGFPFEKYVSRILKARGYEVQVGVLLKGRCVTHEVDVVARNGGDCHMVECKFHKGGSYSSVQTALYVHARFQDIRKAQRAAGEVQHRGMLVTNTRFSSEAIKFAECVGLRAVGWKHPEGEGLERIIDLGGTYPVSVLPSLKAADVMALLRSDIVTLRDLRDRKLREIMRVTGFGHDAASRLKDEAGRMCG